MNIDVILNLIQINSIFHNLSWKRWDCLAVVHPWVLQAMFSVSFEGTANQHVVRRPWNKFRISTLGEFLSHLEAAIYNKNVFAFGFPHLVSPTPMQKGFNLQNSSAHICTELCERVSKCSTCVSVFAGTPILFTFMHFSRLLNKWVDFESARKRFHHSGGAEMYAKAHGYEPARAARAGYTRFQLQLSNRKVSAESMTAIFVRTFSWCVTIKLQFWVAFGSSIHLLVDFVALPILFANIYYMKDIYTFAFICGSSFQSQYPLSRLHITRHLYINRQVSWVRDGDSTFPIYNKVLCALNEIS